MEFYDSFLKKLNMVADDERKLQVFLANWVFRIISIVSAVMCSINLLTGKYALAGATLLFALICRLDILLAKRDMGKALTAFSGEVILLFLYFLISGSAEGFSTIWFCLLPVAGLILYGKKRGTGVSLLVFLILALFFWTPLKGVLRYDYTESFRLRFPFLYLSFFVLGYVAEEIRSITYQNLKESKEKYVELSFHDSLTGVLNNLGLQRAMNKAEDEGIDEATCLVIDVDDMKAINGAIGHADGDIFFCQVANIIIEFFEKKGTIARWNGSSFSIFLPGKKTWREEALSLQQQISAETLKVSGIELNITVTIGGAHGKANTTLSYTEVLREADKNMYEAKKSGPNSFCFPKGSLNFLA